MYIHTYIYTCVYIYIYIERERYACMFLSVALTLLHQMHKCVISTYVIWLSAPAPGAGDEAAAGPDAAGAEDEASAGGGKANRSSVGVGVGVGVSVSISPSIINYSSSSSSSSSTTTTTSNSRSSRSSSSISTIRRGLRGGGISQQHHTNHSKGCFAQNTASLLYTTDIYTCPPIHIYSI